MIQNKRKGFSLVELIVVIAIMAVLVLVLAPALLQHNERSRAEKDNKTMDEVVNAIELALADQEIYDEVLQYSTTDNISCYVDTNSEANYQAIITKRNPDGIDQYTFDSTSRQLDETPYFAAGNMRGVTITFAPNKGSNGSTFDLRQGVVNQYIQIKGNQRFGAMPKLYGRVKSSVGEMILNTSQTYRNSEYTVFIVMGTIGGKDESAQSAVRMYGQWSGTNLPAEVSYQLVTDRVVGDTGNTIVDIDDNKWNETNGSKITLKPGDLNGGGSYNPNTITGNQAEDVDEPLENIELGSVVIDGDYTYTLIEESGETGWKVSVVDKTKESYSEIKSTLKGYKTISLQETFSNCTKMLVSPTIPNGIINMNKTFNGCWKLTEIPSIPNGVLNMSRTFVNCLKLTESPTIPDSVIDMEGTFWGCMDLIKAPAIPDGITSLYNTFYYCSALIEAPVIPSGVNDLNLTFYMCTKLETVPRIPSNVKTMIQTFEGCKNLTGEIEINASSLSCTNAFKDTEKLIKLVGSSDLQTKADLADTANNGNVIYDGMTNKEQPGLYNSKNELISDWDTLVVEYGMNVEKNYTSSTVNTDQSSPKNVLKNNTNLSIGTKIVLPDSIDVIGDYAFYQYSTLQTIVISNSVKKVGQYAFAYCTKTQELVLGEGLEEIGKGAFVRNDILSSVTFPESLKRIENSAFSTCYKLKSIHIPKDVEYIGESVFSGCHAMQLMSVDTDNVTYDSRNNCNAIVETSTNSIISGCKNTVIPNNIVRIGDNAFRDCKELKNIVLPDSIQIIDYMAFYGCSGLTSLQLPKNLVEIANHTFSSCIGLETITLPSSLKEISGCSFSYCKNLISIYFEHIDTPPICASNALKTNSKKTMYFKNESIRSKIMALGTGIHDSNTVFSTNYSW